ncbi:MAG: ABC transporter ATP-binding protein, partial [Pseudomonadota bacterium]
MSLEIALQSKSFGDTQVLGNVDLSFPDGQIAVLLGPSGCGKSTLLSLIAGLDDEYVGKFTAPDGPIAMVFQGPRLLPWRTLAQNIGLIPGSGGIGRARQLLARVGLHESADQFPQKVSLGMQRRASLARALAIKPSLILMDEPLVSLDAETAADMRGLIAGTLAEAGATTLIATHDRREALHLADRIIALGGTPTGVVSDVENPIPRGDRHDP